MQPKAVIAGLVSMDITSTVPPISRADTCPHLLDQFQVALSNRHHSKMRRLILEESGVMNPITQLCLLNSIATKHRTVSPCVAALTVRTVIRRSYALVVGLHEPVSPRPPRLHRISTHHDRPPFSGRPSLTGHCGHGLTCSLPRPCCDRPQLGHRLDRKSLSAARLQQLAYLGPDARGYRRRLGGFRTSQVCLRKRQQERAINRWPGKSAASGRCGWAYPKSGSRQVPE